MSSTSNLEDAVTSVATTAADAMVPGLAAAISVAKAVLAGAGISQSDLDVAIQSYVLDELPRLFSLVRELDIAKCGVNEAYELTLQTVANYQRTINKEKRRSMTNVLVNGLGDEHRDSAAHRLFIRAVADFEAEHVNALREALDGAMSDFHDSPVHNAELTSRGLFRRHEEVSIPLPIPESRRGQGSRLKARSRVEYVITDLGERFLEYLREPLAKKSED